jgi:hypothetical protein
MTVRSVVVNTRRTLATGAFKGTCNSFAASRSAVPIVSVWRALLMAGVYQDWNHRFLAKALRVFPENPLIEIDRNHAIRPPITRMYAMPEDVTRRRLSVLGAQGGVGAALRDVDDLRRGVAIDLGKLGQSRLDLKPAILPWRAGNEGATPCRASMIHRAPAVRRPVEW